MITKRATAIAVLTLSLAGCSAFKSGFNNGLHGKQTAHVTKSDFGTSWPLTVDAGTLACDPTAIGAGDVTFEAGGRTYALNGTAKDHTKLPAIDPIWAKDPSIPGAKKDITALIDRGLALCR